MTDEIVALTMVSGQYPRSDGVLLAEFRTGGEDAARRLYERYAGRLRRLAESYCKNQYTSRFDAEDVVQSVFRIFFQGVRGHGYDASSDGELWGLLSVIALNKVRGNIDHHSAAKRSVERTCSLPDALLPEMSSDESAAVFLKMVVDEQLERCPEEQREIVRWRIEGYEIGEIASFSQRSTRTVERILLEFRLKLVKSD